MTPMPLITAPVEDHQESKKKVGLLALRIPVLILLALGAMALIAFFAL